MPTLSFLTLPDAFEAGGFGSLFEPGVLNRIPILVFGGFAALCKFDVLDRSAVLGVDSFESACRLGARDLFDVLKEDVFFINCTLGAPAPSLVLLGVTGSTRGNRSTFNLLDALGVCGFTALGELAPVPNERNLLDDL